VDPTIPPVLAQQALHLRKDLAASMPDFADITERFSAGIDGDSAHLHKAVLAACMGREPPDRLADSAPFPPSSFNPSPE
jgi:hypothetical protein